MPTLFQAPASAAPSPKRLWRVGDEASAGKPAKITKKSVKQHGDISPPATSHVRSLKTPLTCFAVNLSGVRFETQQDDEEVILFLRQHIIVNVPWIIIAIVFLLAPLVFFPMILANLKLPFAIPAGYILVGILLWYLATTGFILMSFLRWFFNIYIVTNERIVDIDFIHILYKEFSEARLVNIQDITYNTGGIFESFFNYGNVLIQTAGTQPNFDFLSVPRPNTVVQTVSELVEKVKKEGGV